MRPRLVFVLTAFMADACRADAGRFLAALRAWDANDFFEAALCPSRFSAADVALERRADGLRCFSHAGGHAWLAPWFWRR